MPLEAPVTTAVLPASSGTRRSLSGCSDYEMKKAFTGDQSLIPDPFRSLARKR
jgi:hypothetical protein